MGNTRSAAHKLLALNLEYTTRPKPLTREALSWAYVFVTLTGEDDRRLEPGPFDDELAGIVGAIEAERHHAD